MRFNRVGARWVAPETRVVDVDPIGKNALGVLGRGAGRVVRSLAHQRPGVTGARHNIQPVARKARDGFLASLRVPLVAPTDDGAHLVGARGTVIARALAAL